MKKHYSILFAAGIVANMTFAQITITSADMLSIGDNYVEATESYPALAPGSGGANKTWNFNTLGTDFLDTILITTPSSTPYSNYFPLANIVAKRNGSNVYYKKTSSELQVVGQTYNNMGQNQIVKYNLPAKTMEFPATYQTQWKNESRNVQISADASLNIYGYDSVKILAHTVSFDTIDGWGSITLKSGTYNCIRNKDYFIFQDSIFYHNIISNKWIFGGFESRIFTSYIWYSNEIRSPLASMFVDSTGSILSATWHVNSLTGIDEHTIDSATLIYPNPATDRLTIQLNSILENDYIEIYDVTNALKMKGHATQLLKHDMDISELSPGIYFLRLTNDQQSLTSRFVKQ